MASRMIRLTAEQLRAATARIAASEGRRSEVRRQLKDGKLPAEIDTAEAVAKHFRRLGVESLMRDEVRLERVLGASNLVPAATLERGARVGRAVARVRILDADGSLAGWGTGFMISPSLFMTNNHVLTKPEDAATSRVEFNYQDGVDGKPLPVAVFDLDPGTFFETDPVLDFTIVAVRASSPTLALLSSFGFCRLIATTGKVLDGEYLNIIQHPEGQPKQVALRENRLLARVDNFLHYETDTAPGSSGSPVFNDQWEVVALHHAGVPATNAAGQHLAMDGSVWTEDMGESRLKWVANEGTRISSIHARLKGMSASGAKARLLEEVLNPAPGPGQLESASLATTATKNGGCGCSAGGAPSGPAGSGPDVVGSTATWTIPIRVSIDLGCGGVASPAVPAASSVAVDPGRSQPPVDDADLREALAEVREARTRPYYSKVDDERDRDRYYANIDLAADDLYQPLSDLVEATHTTRLKYKPSVHVYPWLDLQPNLRIKSVYSGKEYDAEDLVREDIRVGAARAARIREMYRQEASLTKEVLDVLEASLPYNCEHVIPQSWFAKHEPMRGDLHHLFACESGCNSFRGNIPYFDFADFEEVTRGECGKREGNRFEPGQGKGPVARAVLYFVLRYPGEVNSTDKEYEAGRLQTLIEWHKAHPVSTYERHRNAVACQKQGNRNPLIDFPDIVDQINFSAGLG